MKSLNLTREGISPAGVIYVVLLILSILLLLLSERGILATRVQQSIPIAGERTVISPEGNEILYLDVDESGFTKLRYRGLFLVGQLVRSTADQESAYYSLLYNSVSKVSFSIQIPNNYDSNDPTGSWAIRFRNQNCEFDNSSQAAAWMFTGYSNPDLIEAKYEKISAKSPGELFDWLYIGKDGMANYLCLDFIPSRTTNEFNAISHELRWSENSKRTLYLSLS